MTIAIVIPYRGTDSDKSRLRQELDENRVKFVLEKMIQQIIYEISKLNEKINLYILSKNEVKISGKYENAIDQGNNLNESLEIFTSNLKEEIIMIIMADLPLITKKNIAKILTAVSDERKVIIAPAADEGTSILCYNKNLQFPFFYGQKSAKKLAEYLDKHEISYQVLEYEYRYQDIDTLKDLIKLNENIELPKWLKKHFEDDLK